MPEKEIGLLPSLLYVQELERGNHKSYFPCENGLNSTKYIQSPKDRKISSRGKKNFFHAQA